MSKEDFIETGLGKKKSSPLKLFGIFSLRFKSFSMKFCRFVGNAYPHLSTNFCRFILIFQQMALILIAHQHTDARY